MQISRAIVLLFTVCGGGGIRVDTKPPEAADLPSKDLDSNVTTSGRQAGYGLVRFEGETNPDPNKYGLVTFSETSSSNRPLKFEDGGGPSSTPAQNSVNPSAPGPYQGNVSFQDNLSADYSGENLSQNSGQTKKRRKRKRKFRPLPNQTIAEQQQLELLPDKLSQLVKPKKEMTGSLGAISAALNSVVENDTAHCVSRMLCEQAASGGVGASFPTLQTIGGIMQYLPQLFKTGGLNSFPLFKSVTLLGIAIRTGITSGNQTACVAKYPECPSDPEERIHYINNHNGGLFRFFGGTSAPQYDAEKFHNHLLQLGLPSQPYNTLQQKKPLNGQYGVYRPQPSAGPYYGAQQTYSSPGQYGLHQGGQYGIQRPNKQSYYRPNSNSVFQNNQQLYGNTNGFSRPNAPQINQQQYGSTNRLSGPSSAYKGPNQGNSNYSPAYTNYRRFNNKGTDHRSSSKENKDSENEIQKRIQNRPEIFIDKTFENKDVSSKWSFPKIESLNVHNAGINKVRDGRHIKFPDIEKPHEQDTNRKEENGFCFPGAQSNREILEISSDYSSNDDFIIDNEGSDYSINDFQIMTDDDGVETVYIVRGNGDPNHPEIIKIRSGEKIQ